MVWPSPGILIVPLMSTPLWETSTELDVIVPGTSDWPLVNSVIPAFGETPVAPFAGRCVITLGDVVVKSTAVVKLLWKATRAFPERSVTNGVATTVIVVAGGKLPVSMAVRLSEDSVRLKPTGASPAKSCMVLPLTVAGLRDFEKVSTTIWLRPIPEAPFAGVTDVTTGAALSVVLPVVNVPEPQLSLLPAKSRTWHCVYHWIVILAGYGCAGVNVALAPLTESTAHVPAMSTKP